MDKNFKRKRDIGDLLSQSYYNGIKRLAGNEEQIPYDFKIPSNVLDRRKKAWEELFTKYTLASKTKSNMVSLRYEDESPVVSQKTQRMPMRKPMSWVQYWVNTGRPYTGLRNTRVSSSSESSVAQEESLNRCQDENLPLLTVQCSPNKNSALDERPEKNLRLLISSSSSVDTAAYILANNNTTKKADMIAIVEGAKGVDTEKSQTSQNNKVIHSTKNCLVKNQDVEKDCLSKSATKKSTNKEKSYFEIFESDSNESIVNKTNSNNLQTLSENYRFQNSFNVNDKDESKLRRKKLYVGTESMAEFTPASEDNLSTPAVNTTSQNCEHPALETPKIPSRSSHLIKYKRFRATKQHNRRLLRSFNSIVYAKQNINKQCDINQSQNEERENSLNTKNITNNESHVKEYFDKKEVSFDKKNFNKNLENVSYFENKIDENVLIKSPIKSTLHSNYIASVQNTLSQNDQVNDKTSNMETLIVNSCELSQNSEQSKPKIKSIQKLKHKIQHQEEEKRNNYLESYIKFLNSRTSTRKQSHIAESDEDDSNHKKNKGFENGINQKGDSTRIKNKPNLKHVSLINLKKQSGSPKSISNYKTIIGNLNIEKEYQFSKENKNKNLKINGSKTSSSEKIETFNNSITKKRLRYTLVTSSNESEESINSKESNSIKQYSNKVNGFNKKLLSNNKKHLTKFRLNKYEKVNPTKKLKLDTLNKKEKKSKTDEKEGFENNGSKEIEENLISRNIHKELSVVQEIKSASIVSSSAETPENNCNMKTKMNHSRKKLKNQIICKSSNEKNRQNLNISSVSENSLHQVNDSENISVKEKMCNNFQTDKIFPKSFKQKRKISTLTESSSNEDNLSVEKVFNLNRHMKEVKPNIHTKKRKNVSYSTKKRKTVDHFSSSSEDQNIQSQEKKKLQSNNKTVKNLSDTKRINNSLEENTNIICNSLINTKNDVLLKHQNSVKLNSKNEKQSLIHKNKPKNRKSEKEKIKKAKKSSINLKKKNSSFNESSDDDCIIPLRIK